MSWCLTHRLKVIAMGCIFFAAVLITSFFALKFILMPRIDPDGFSVVVEAPQGTSLERTAELVRRVEAAVDKVVPTEARQSYKTVVGHHDTGGFGISKGRHDYWARISVFLKPAQERDIRSEFLMEKLRERFKSMEGFDKLVIVPFQDGPPVGKPVKLVFTANDEPLLQKLDREAVAYLKAVDGVYGIESSMLTGKDELRLMLDYDRMAKVGVTSLDVGQTVRAAFEGEVVTSVTKDNEEIDFRVSLKDPKKYRAEGVLNLSDHQQGGEARAVENLCAHR